VRPSGWGPACLGLLGLLGLLLAAPPSAQACATCGCGDPTLTVMGAEAPFAGRVRLSARLRYRGDAIGTEGVDRAEVHEGVLTLGASWAPTDWLVLSGEAPLVFRHVRWAHLARAATFGPGDAELRGRAVLLRDRAFAPSHLLGVHAGVKLPTSLDQVGGDGQRLPVEAQTGTGTVDPILGLFYTHLADPWAVFSTATVALPTAGRFAEAPGPSLRATAAVQYRVDRRITLRGAVDLRFDAPASVGDGTDPRSDHFAVFLSPDLLWAPVPDVILGLGLRVPVAQLSEQGRTEGLYAVTSVVVDL
jgi:hypothetical protein